MIVIATPTRDNVNGGFAYDLVNLIKHSPEAIFTIANGSILSNLRCLLAKTAVEEGASHILFLDSDMRFPEDTLKKLLSHNLDIVGANCKQRTQDEFTARKNGKFISSKNKTGIEEVDIVGCGVTLIKTDVFKKLDKPWFSMPWDGKSHIGEDVFFCTIAKDAGFKIFIDHDLSQNIRHVGDIELGIK